MVQPNCNPDSSFGVRLEHGRCSYREPVGPRFRNVSSALRRLTADESYRGRLGKKSFPEGGKPEGRGGALPWGVNMSGGRGQPGGIEGIEDEQI
jgi:hypothetical protein